MIYKKGKVEKTDKKDKEKCKCVLRKRKRKGKIKKKTVKENIERKR
jgi:hypothetical protein